jgi:hypothetical protein
MLFESSGESTVFDVLVVTDNAAVKSCLDHVGIVSATVSQSCTSESVSVGERRSVESAFVQCGAVSGLHVLLVQGCAAQLNFSADISGPFE